MAESMGDSGALQAVAVEDDFSAAVWSSAINDIPFVYASSLETCDGSREEEDASDGNGDNGEEDADSNEKNDASVDNGEEDANSVGKDGASDDNGEEDNASYESGDEFIIPDELYAEQLSLQEALMGSLSLNRIEIDNRCIQCVLKIEGNYQNAENNSGCRNDRMMESSLEVTASEGCDLLA